MKLSRPVSWFLLAFGVWSWFIWVTFVKNLWNDASGLAFDAAGDPTAYFWVHLLLAVTSFLLGTAVGAVGLRGLRALRREKNPTPATSPRLLYPSPSPRDSASPPMPSS
ncbi:SCO4848 family membrane protein, partial [Streptomyces sp. McG5]|uniref:SCO4848 family membrane protein n=1 Tax=Streptomyces sp. McG5 TaxID=2725484 RepID=UPI0020369D67